MLNFYTKSLIFFILIWTCKYLSENMPLYFYLAIHRISCDKEYNRNNILSAVFRRLLCSETIVAEERKHNMLKKGINDLLYKSDDSSVERLNLSEHDDEFRKIFTNLMQRDISNQEFVDLMRYTKLQKHYDSLQFEHKLKKKYNNLKHYNNVQKRKNIHTSLKKVEPRNNTCLFQNRSSKSYHNIKHQDIVKTALYLKKNSQVISLIKSKKKFIKILYIIIIIILFCVSIIWNLYVAKSCDLDKCPLRMTLGL
ncbi:Plasmodium exported protein, unknown function [Plasmodium malariae]|uniref:Pv-fam-d protein n=1 Tax=Plasmodium malariae TaxID=5858 RepID=A0A1D3JI47_PLAMA|nr:Plasmodium exported protein, unknown function [Plasmodium malariae]SBT86115.1 Plasmodium exported protein, unknown function [Plasmodium malariae]